LENIQGTESFITHRFKRPDRLLLFHVVRGKTGIKIIKKKKLKTVKTPFH